MVFKYTAIILLTGIVVFIIWMNVTPGHYQPYACGCVKYYEKPAVDDSQKNIPINPYCPICPIPMPIPKALLLLGRIDLYK